MPVLCIQYYASCSMVCTNTCCIVNYLNLASQTENETFLGDRLSFADIIAACELMQPTMSGRDVLAGRPKLQKWLERVQNDSQPFFDEAHQIFYRSRDRIKNRL